TQPRLVTEPTTKPTLAPPRHSSTPTCTRCTCCALAPPIDDASAARAARMRKRRMKKSPAGNCDASRIKNNAVPAALAVLCHNITGRAKLAGLKRAVFIRLSFRGGAKRRTSDVQLHIGESRDSQVRNCAPYFDAVHRPG